MKSIRFKLIILQTILVGMLMYVALVLLLFSLGSIMVIVDEPEQLKRLVAFIVIMAKYIVPLILMPIAFGVIYFIYFKLNK